MSGARDMAPLQAASAQVRSHKAHVKRELAAGRLTLRQVLLDPPRSARVEEVLRAVPSIGPYKANTLCRSLMIHPDKPLAELTSRQRALLGCYLQERHPGIWRRQGAAARRCRVCGEEVREGRMACGRCSRERRAA